MYALYIGIFISPIQILVELTEMMQKGLSGFRRFLEVVETEPEIVDAADAKPLKNVKGNVCYEDVSFHYSDDENDYHNCPQTFDNQKCGRNSRGS